MATFSTAHVVAYLNTGFSTTNTPLNPSVMISSATTSVDLGTINCLSLIGKTAGVITVRDFNGLEQADYLKIDFSDSSISSYWLISSYDYVSGDTVNLTIALDAWLTCGGNTGISAVSGYVVRHTVADDTYGKYSQEDEMLIPSQHLIFRCIDKFGNRSQSTPDYWHIVVATINLWALGKNNASDMGLTYGDVTNNEYVVVPDVPKIPLGVMTTIEFNQKTYKMPCTLCFDGDSDDVQEGISRARSLGIDDCIIAQYALPKSDFGCDKLSLPDPISGTTIQTDAITRIYNLGGGWIHNSNVAFTYATVNNKRALYGNLNKVRLTSIASGEEVEYSIEDLYSSTAQNQLVQIIQIGDARPHGKPYFFPKYYMNQEVDTDNMLTSISGMEWQNTPLRFDYGSRAGLNAVRWEAERVVAKENMLDQMVQAQKNAYAGAVTGFTNGVAGSSIGMMGSTIGGEGGGQLAVAQMGLRSLQGLASGYTNAFMAYENAKVEASIFARNRALEKKDMLIDNNVVAPDIRFPVSEAIRDFVGNGVIVSQISPTDADVARFDKVLNMFGYKDAGTELTTADFTAGTYFSYIEATDVHIQTGVAVNRVIKEACEEQIRSGIRLWKARPDFTKYSADNRA